MNIDTLLSPGSAEQKASRLVAAAAEFWNRPVEFVRQVTPMPLPKGQSVRTVAIFFPTTGIGGGERMTQFLANLWRNHGYHVVLLTEEELPERQRDAIPDVSCYQIPTYLDATPETYDRRARAITKILTKENVDALVFAHWFSPTMPFDLALARLLAVRPYVFVQSSFALFYTDPYLGADYQSVPVGYALADAVVCLSQMDALYWHAFNPNVYVAPNPLSLPFPTEAAPLEGHTVLWPHRLHPDKEPERAVRILAELVKSVPDARLRMVGRVDDACLAGVTALAQELGVEENLDVAGPVRPMAIADAYQSADAFLLTSSQEGFPLTVQEAMAYGVPVVMYGLPHLTLCQCEAVCQIAPDDAPAAARALADRLTDKKLARKLGHQERAFVQALDAFDHASLWEHLFQGEPDEALFDPDPSTLQRLSTLMVQELVRAQTLGVRRRTVNERVRTATLREELRLTHQHADNLQGMLDRERATAEAAQSRVQTLTEQLAALRDSVSFRVGRALTFLPRAACTAVNNIGRRLP